ncbi:MAG: Uma2 family endonuclease [Verrucomicrobia bacterium]|nr:Uma2 family endonuclease [Leptolyngbya sp. ES-bin-22]
MVTTPDLPVVQTSAGQVTPLVITWEPLPDDVPLEDEPVENTGQPLIAGALRESLELVGFIQPEMLIASNFGLCATVNGDLVIKAPDWVYVPSVHPSELAADRRSYTPTLQGDVPLIAMEFLSHKDGGEYSVKRSFPPGKWFFYEQILKIPVYAIFEPADGLLEIYQLTGGRYELQLLAPENRCWIAEMGLCLGVWQGTKGERTGYWLRWWDEGGNLLPWAVEQIAQERQRAEQERQRAEQERQRAEKLAEYLRSQGIDPDAL